MKRLSMVMMVLGLMYGDKAMACSAQFNTGPCKGVAQEAADYVVANCPDGKIDNDLVAPGATVSNTDTIEQRAEWSFERFKNIKRLCPPKAVERPRANTDSAVPSASGSSGAVRNRSASEGDAPKPVDATYKPLCDAATFDSETEATRNDCIRAAAFCAKPANARVAFCDKFKKCAERISNESGCEAGKRSAGKAFRRLFVEEHRLNGGDVAKFDLCAKGSCDRTDWGIGRKLR